MRNKAEAEVVADPQLRKVGMELKFKAYGLDFYGFTNDFKENLGLAGFRVSKKLMNSINIGGSYVTDRNQYLGLRDRDDDGRPDLVDDFPNDPGFWLDTDGDGLADGIPEELDIDGGNSFEPMKLIRADETTCTATETLIK